MRKTCRLCRGTLTDDKLSEKCDKCEGKEGCPLIGSSSILCQNCRDKIENKDESLQRMFENLSHEERMKLLYEIKTLHISVMAEKLMDILHSIESGIYSHENKMSPFEDILSKVLGKRPEKNPIDLFSEILGKISKEKPEKKPGDIFSNLSNMRSDPFSNFNKRPPFMNN